MLNLNVPIGPLTLQKWPHEVWLAIGNSKVNPAGFEDARYLAQVLAGVLHSVVGRVPGTSMYHDIECAFVKGGINRGIGNTIHVTHIHHLPPDHV